MSRQSMYISMRTYYFLVMLYAARLLNGKTLAIYFPDMPEWDLNLPVL